MRVFDNIAYVHVPKEKRRTLDAKAEKCILVSYSDEQKGCKCYNPQTKKVQVRRDEKDKIQAKPKPKNQRGAEETVKPRKNKRRN